MSLLDPLLKQLSQLLLKHKLQLVTAESCTGGLVAGLITEIPGSSAWFERGFITYSNLAKQEMLGVKEALILQHGAVSQEVALAMATGALNHSKGHIALSVTGIAGPDGGSVAKPVGTVWLAWAAHGVAPQASKKLFTGSRQEIRLAACQYALEGALAYTQRVFPN